MELSQCLSVTKQGLGRCCSQARASPWISDATFKSSDTVSVDNEDSPRVVRFRVRREHGSGCFLLHFLAIMFIFKRKQNDRSKRKLS